MSKESIVAFFRSKFFVGIIFGVCIMFVVMGIFKAGVMVGYHEATFSSRWGQNYEQNFGGMGMMPGLPNEHLPNPDGTFGKIISISTTASTTTLVVNSPQNPEEKIVVSADTLVRDHMNTINVTTLSAGSYVVVLGSPNNQGEIEAKLVRVVPAPGTTTPSSAELQASY
jgi:hypothetical protein